MPSIYWKKAIGVLACLFLLCGLLVAIPAAGTAEAQEAKLFTILHTNDEHGEVIPYGPSIDYPDDPTTGGFSRIANEIGRIKAEKAAASEPVLTLSAGDISQGTLFSWLESQPSGHVELSLLQAMGYDAVAIGNHEFDMGSGYRAQVYGQAKADGITLPILCANMTFDDTDPQAAALHALYSTVDKQGTELAIQPYTVKTLSNGLKVGIFGLLGVEAEVDAPAAGMTGVTFGNVIGHPTDPVGFINRVNVAQNMVNTLRADGCDVVVALTHCGTSEEEMLAQFVNGIDVIVGGHSHDLNYPPIVVGDTTIVQAGSYGRYLGELELEYAGGKVSVRNATAIPIDENIPTVPAIDAAIANYVAALNGFLGFDIMAPYAETDLFDDGGFNLNDMPPWAETNLGDLITDSFLLTSTLVDPTRPTRIAVEGNGVIRNGIPKGASGVFNFYDLYRSFPLGVDLSGTQPVPLGYPLVNFYLFGAELQGALEAILDLGINTYFLQMAGARYTYNAGGPEGGKIIDFEMDDMAGGWEPVNPGALYRVATSQYDAYFLSAFGLAPRDETGATTTVDACIVYAGPNQVKCWQALAGMVASMPDLDGDGLPNIVPDYKYPQLRIENTNWYLAEGSTLGGMETYVLVQNPDPITDAHVNIFFQTDTGEVAPADLQGVTIPAGSRSTFMANNWVSSYNASTVVEPIDGMVVCERAMYGDGGAWAHDSIGATSPEPAQEWYLAEGSTDLGMETWLLVQNSYQSTVHVNVSFQTDTGEVAPAELQGVAIPAESRATFFVGEWVPNELNVSTYVEAQDGMVVCERAMYGGEDNWATDSIGTSVLSDEWYLAEGCTDGGMQTYVLVQNPGDDDVHVNVTFNTDLGDIAPLDLQNVLIPARSRRTFMVNGWVTTYNVSTHVQCLDGAVVAERAMYGGGGAWAHDSVGTASPGNVFFLPEGCTGGGMQTYILVQNPDPTTDAIVDIVFQTGGGEVAPLDLQDITIPAGSRSTFMVNGWLTDYNVSTLVLATEGRVVVERAMYGPGGIWATDSIGYMMDIALEDLGR
ncbi:MAG: 5'-nucleotidase C-terminal domain-containing protein [Actinomycetota bacterium]